MVTRPVIPSVQGHLSYVPSYGNDFPGYRAYPQILDLDIRLSQRWPHRLHDDVCGERIEWIIQSNRLYQVGIMMYKYHDGGKTVLKSSNIDTFRSKSSICFLLVAF